MFDEIRYSLRSLARDPPLLGVLLLSLALGVGSNAVVYAFVRGLVTPSLRLPHLERVVTVYSRDAQGRAGAPSYADFLAMRGVGAALESLGAAREWRASLTVDGRTSTVAAVAVTTELSDLLELGSAPGVRVSDHLRRTQLRSTADIRGHPVVIDGVQTQVAAQVPDGLDGLYTGQPVDVWVPWTADSIAGVDPRRLRVALIGRLAPGASVEAAQQAIRGALPDSPLVLRPYTGLPPEAAAGFEALTLLLRLAAVGILLATCANMAAFLLTRATVRAFDTSVRVALGATRHRIARGLMYDSIIIALLGSAAGLLLGSWTADLLPALLYAEQAEWMAFRPSAGGILASAAACLGVTALCGLLPLTDRGHHDPATVLRREAGGPSRRAIQLQGALSIAQLTCCCLLLVPSMLLATGFHAVLRAPPGARAGETILVDVEAAAGFDRPDLGRAYFGDVERAAASVPGVFSTAWIDTPPGRRASSLAVHVDLPPGDPREVVMQAALLTPELLPSIVMPPLAGRMFGGGDTPQSCKVALVNRAAAEQFFGGIAVGRLLHDPARNRLEIIGVVDAAGAAGGGSASAPPTVYYYPEQTGGQLPVATRSRFVAHAGEARQIAVLDGHVASAQYFGLLDLGIRDGAVWEADIAASACRVGVVNAIVADEYFGGRAIGGAVIDASGVRTEIVGVVPAKAFSAAQRRVDAALYTPAAQNFVPRMTLLLALARIEPTTMAVLGERIERVRGGRMLRGGPTTLHHHLRRTALASEWIATLLVSAGTAVALLLTVLGTAGAMREFVRQRRREFALRRALGAPPWRLVAQVLARAVRLAGVGIAAGTAGATLILVAISRVMPTAAAAPLWAWIAGPVVLLAVVLLSCVGSIRDVLRIDVLSLMRAD